MFSYRWSFTAGAYVISEKKQDGTVRIVGEIFSKGEAETYVNWRNSQTRYERDGTA